MSRPVTIEELRRVLDAMEVHGHRLAASAVPLLAHSAVNAARAALPAEQEQQPQLGKPAGSASYVAPSSAVPELPPIAQDFVATPPSQGTGYPCVRQRDYAALRTAAEALRERLVDALRERNGLLLRAQQAEAGEQDAIAAADRSARLRREAEAERDEARALAWEQAERTHGARGDVVWWHNLYTTHIAHFDKRAEQAEAERDALRSQMEQAQRQEPVAWTRPEGAFRWWAWAAKPADDDMGPYTPLYAAPVPAAEAAAQIAAAEQRGRAAAFEEVAAECERRHAEAERSGVYWSGYPSLIAWCRRLAEEARG